MIYVNNDIFSCSDYTWLTYIRSYTEDPNYGFLRSWWFIQNWFMDLDNLSEVVVHYLLIRGMTCFGYQNGFLMVGALLCMVVHWRWPMVSHDIDYHIVVTSPNYYVAQAYYLERILS